MLATRNTLVMSHTVFLLPIDDFFHFLIEQRHLAFDSNGLLTIYIFEQFYTDTITVYSQKSKKLSFHQPLIIHILVLLIVSSFQFESNYDQIVILLVEISKGSVPILFE